MTENGSYRKWYSWIPIALLLVILLTSSELLSEEGFRRASRLPDLSGLAWMGDDLFLTVHDAKNPEEINLPRVSLLKLPTGLDGILWKPLRVEFLGQKSNDFESAARIPGMREILLVESTEEQQEKPFSRRIFLAELNDRQVQIVDVITWPTQTKNVEGSAVARVKGNLIFIYAERAQGQGDTKIHFADLMLEPLDIGGFKDAGVFTSPKPKGKNARPVTAMEVDRSGVIYVASAEDPGDDNGPFRSAVYKIGRVEMENSEPKVILDDKPTLLATLDGLKVESLAVRKQPGKNLEIFVGLDDENYGGTLRPIPLQH